jgi:hypothetical protein
MLLNWVRQEMLERREAEIRAKVRAVVEFPPFFVVFTLDIG